MSHEDDPDRDAILARRRRLIALALAGLTATVTMGTDCGGGPDVCLGATIPDGGPDSGQDAGMDAGPMACLSDAGDPEDA